MEHVVYLSPLPTRQSTSISHLGVAYSPCTTTVIATFFKDEGDGYREGVSRVTQKRVLSLTAGLAGFL